MKIKATQIIRYLAAISFAIIACLGLYHYTITDNQLATINNQLINLEVKYDLLARSDSIYEVKVDHIFEYNLSSGMDTLQNAPVGLQYSTKLDNILNLHSDLKSKVIDLEKERIGFVSFTIAIGGFLFTLINILLVQKNRELEKNVENMTDQAEEASRKILYLQKLLRMENNDIKGYEDIVSSHIENIANSVKRIDTKHYDLNEVIKSIHLFAMEYMRFEKTKFAIQMQRSGDFKQEVEALVHIAESLDRDFSLPILTNLLENPDPFLDDDEIEKKQEIIKDLINEMK